ncbi:nucleotide sugar dehydrogenase [Streptomyces graminilatus]|uniref:nucleotide sugar dehydrogenase n=1 Tax=Streptomyces graminilatus TaxID=1464070 RepID=UPI00099EE5ED|nr:nucleotide sugar dehydrogenase [Streptomyces graminilatus]
MARIFVVGSGVVGTATGKGFLHAGHKVTFIDVDERRLEVLRSEGLDAHSRLDLRAEPSSFVFLTLPTPNVGHAYDLSAFEAGTASVGESLRESYESHIVVVRSTVPPGTAESLVQPLLEKHSGRTTGEGFTVASNPEFLRAASAVEDFRHPWMTVVASRSARTRERLGELLQPFGGDLRFFENPAEAELVKCAHNIYNATKISFWNEMWLVSQELGLDLDPIAQTVARSAEGSVNPLYGIRGGAPYGGVCLPKDTQGFLGLADSIGLHMPLLKAVVEVNDQLAGAVGERSGTPVTSAV